MSDQLPALRGRMVVRPVQLDDAEGLKATCWRDRSAASVREFLQRARRMMAERRGVALVAAADQLACGFGMLTIWPRAAEISDLIVTPALRGQGIGTQLITALTEAARGLNATVVEIGVALGNVRALQLYRRLGFREYRSVYLDLGAGPELVLFLKKSLQGAVPG